jgi:hypothetical protein
MPRGGGVDDRSRIVLSAVLGAIAGGVAGYLFLTEDGRRVRERIGPGMDDVVQEVRRLRSAMDSARVATREGWAAVDDLRRGFADRSETAVRPPRAY